MNRNDVLAAQSEYRQATSDADRATILARVLHLTYEQELALAEILAGPFKSTYHEPLFTSHQTGYKPSAP